nr:MAG TPA: hypothetical protein [Caudoviricetes sp.]
MIKNKPMQVKIIPQNICVNILRSPKKKRKIVKVRPRDIINAPIKNIIIPMIAIILVSINYSLLCK